MDQRSQDRRNPSGNQGKSLPVPTLVSSPVNKPELVGVDVARWRSEQHVLVMGDGPLHENRSQRRTWLDNRGDHRTSSTAQRASATVETRLRLTRKRGERQSTSTRSLFAYHVVGTVELLTTSPRPNRRIRGVRANRGKKFH